MPGPKPFLTRGYTSLPVDAMVADWMLAGVTGLVVGVVFAAMDLPIPAPPTLSGVMGIIGIFLGYLTVQHWDRVARLLTG